jgi:hypothetical protein
MMKIIFLISFFISNVSYADVNISTQLKDVAYQFDTDKVNASKDSFHFLRSFVDYYYLILKANLSQLKTNQFFGNEYGWCVGDAHPENFGMIMTSKNSSVFTMNDMDDSGSCPVAFDFLRLLVSTHLYSADIDLNDLINSYIKGLKGNSINIPKGISDIIDKSKIRGRNIDPKVLDGEKFNTKIGDNVEPAIKLSISNILSSTFTDQTFEVLDCLETSKKGGGSGGLIRYEVLLKLNGVDSLIHLELKELTTPGIFPLYIGDLPSQAERIKKTLDIVQGNIYDHFYQVISLNNKFFLIRPKYYGNIGVNIPDNVIDSNTTIIEYEAYILGRIHAKTVTSNYIDRWDQVDIHLIENDAEGITKIFKSRFDSLKLP